MKNRRQRVLAWVSGTHAGILLLMLLVPWIKGCIHKEPKIIATFDLGAPPPPPAPEIEPEPVPVPKPEPKPVKKPVPKPAATNAPPKVVKQEPKKEPPKAAPKKTEPVKKSATKPPEKPKTMEQRLAEIRQSGAKVRNPNTPAAPARPNLDLSGIKAALNASGSSTYGTGSGSGSGAYSPYAGYYESIKRQLYSVWQQPAGAPYGLTAGAVLRVESNGSVSYKALTRRSGNSAFDQSVQNALNATTRLPPPPAGLPDRNISVEFSLSD